MAASIQQDGHDTSSVPIRRKSEQGSFPSSPLGATPRRALPQRYNLSKSGDRSKAVEGEKGYLCPRDLFSWVMGSSGHLSKNGIINNEQNQFTSIKSRSRNHSAAHDEESSTKSFILLGLIFVSSFLTLLILYFNSPNLDENEKQYIKVPKDIDDAKNLGKVLSQYKEQYYYQVLFGYFLTYIFLQTFAIPGSIFLSILSGFLFSFPLALFLVCLCSSIGASFCYLLSYLVGRRLVTKYFPERVSSWAQKVQKQKDHLLNYIIFLRITPFLPNWFINVTSPVIEVPLLPFSLGTFIGVAPPSFVAIHAGTTLQKLTSSRDAISWASVVILALLAMLSVLPVYFKKRLQKRFD